MAQKKVHITKSGLSKLEAELSELVTVKRAEVADKIKRAREMGSSENNAEYDLAKNEQAFIRSATIIESPAQPGVVELGNIILIQNQDGKIEQYTIVGSAEADPLDGKISEESPVGKALLGKKQGDNVQVKTPAGLLKLFLLEVS